MLQKILTQVRRTNGLCHTVMTLRKVFCQTSNSEAGLPARFTQTGRCDTHSHGFVQDLDQHHDPMLAIGHLVDAFDAGKWRFGQAHTLTLLEQALRLSLRRCFLCSQPFDQTSSTRAGSIPKLTKRLTLVERTGAQLLAESPWPKRMNR